MGGADSDFNTLLSATVGGEVQTVPPDPTLDLSPRQREVAELVARGMTNQEIARHLFIGVDTVKKHVTQVLRVTGCTNRTQVAIRYATGWR